MPADSARAAAGVIINRMKATHARSESPRPDLPAPANPDTPPPDVPQPVKMNKKEEEEVPLVAPTENGERNDVEDPHEVRDPPTNPRRAP